MLIDTHAHLDNKHFDPDREDVIGRAISAGVSAIINVGYDLESSGRSVDLARRNGFYAAAGVHPHDASSYRKWATDIDRLLDSPGVVAVGEIGLDYYRNLSPVEDQKECFAYYINVARKRHIPVIVHDRDAHEDVIDILVQENARDAGGVLHCFSGDWEMARKVLDMGFHISVGGPITFRSAEKARDVVQKVPLDKLLLETDCPYLAPDPHRGTRNEPGMVRVVAQRVAAVKQMDFEDITAATGRNASLLFGLDKGWRLVMANNPK